MANRQHSPEIEKRRRLFRKSKPHLRPMTDADMWIVWAAYDLGSFKDVPSGLSKEEVFRHFRGIVSSFSTIWLMEDDCKYFKAGRGPVAMIAIRSNGWVIEPHVEYFKWATPRMILRTTVQFMQKARHDKTIGVCLVKSLESTKALFDCVVGYGLLRFVGKIPDGDIRGDEYIYTLRGKKGKDK